MYLIKKCPACGKKLRFPIDRGKIRVACSCGESFIADPDDTSLYAGAAFDLDPGIRRDRAWGIEAAGARLKQQVKKFLDAAIRAAYETRYRLQNFSLLPSADQRKIVIALVLLVAVLFLLGYFICSTAAGPVDDGVI